VIEDKANGPAVIPMLSNEIPGTLPGNPSGGKVARGGCRVLIHCRLRHRATLSSHVSR
jgi:hypothetical protein